MSTNSAWLVVNGSHFTITCTRICATRLKLIVGGVHMGGAVQGTPRHCAGVWEFNGIVVAISDLRWAGLVFLGE
jgi:hypothetical protein